MGGPGSAPFSGQGAGIFGLVHFGYVLYPYIMYYTTGPMGIYYVLSYLVCMLCIIILFVFPKLVMAQLVLYAQFSCVKYACIHTSSKTSEGCT